MGLIVLAGLVVAVLWLGERFGLWEERRLVLATVRDPGGLMVDSPVYFRGVEIGAVIRIDPPGDEAPGYKLRMAVDKAAFIHIPLDSPVRVEGGGARAWQVTILPGREKPMRDFPGKVKVLREVTPTEEALRMVRDLLDGLIDLSRAKATEVEIQGLKDEINKLRDDLQNLEGGTQDQGR